MEMRLDVDLKNGMGTVLKIIYFLCQPDVSKVTNEPTRSGSNSSTLAHHQRQLTIITIFIMAFKQVTNHFNADNKKSSNMIHEISTSDYTLLQTKSHCCPCVSQLNVCFQVVSNCAGGKNSTCHITFSVELRKYCFFSSSWKFFSPLLMTF